MFQVQEKRKAIILVISLVLLIVLTIGGTYAIFTFLGEGQKTNQITTGTLVMEYNEPINALELIGALPTTDKTGKEQKDYFEFTVSKKGTIEDAVRRKYN